MNEAQTNMGKEAQSAYASLRDDIGLFTKHTPGPWIPEYKLSNGTIPFGTVDSDFGAICFVTLQGEQVQANTRLLAAAPDLLQALEQMRACAESCGWRNAEMQNAIAAIAKAKGHL
jgi:hypothetical protein